MKKKQSVRKVVIPAAGFGTRFLPMTKAQPKEMLPVVDNRICLVRSLFRNLVCISNG